MILRILKETPALGTKILKSFRIFLSKKIFLKKKFFFESRLRSLGLLTRDLLLFLEAATLEGASIYLNRSYF
jgi:hypothetical protein